MSLLIHYTLPGASHVQLVSLPVFAGQRVPAEIPVDRITWLQATDREASRCIGLIGASGDQHPMYVHGRDARTVVSLWS